MGRLVAYEEAFDENEDEEIGESEEQDVIAHLSEQNKGKRYEDSSFPASKASLYRSSTALPEYDVGTGELKWLRPHELTQEPAYFKDALSGAGDVIKGRLDDAWLLGALAAVAAHPGNLIENLFSSEPDDFNKYGVYTCRFYINGEWQEIVADTRLPCIALPEGEATPGGALTRHVPMYGRGLNLSELWVPLVEKAYAKLHGTYEALSGGTVGEALVDFTGGSCVRICLSEERVETMVADGRLWDRLRRYTRWQYILACTKEDSSRRGVTADDAGIPVNAACSIVAMRECSGFRLVRVRNPWSSVCQWTGDWCDASPLWDDYPDVYAAVTAAVTVAPALPHAGHGHESSSSSTATTAAAAAAAAAAVVPPWRRDANDGTFWMSYGDFTARFSHVYACRIFPDEAFRQYCVHGEWAGKTAGGAPHLRQQAGATPHSSSSSRSGGTASALGKEQLAAQAKVKENLRRTSLVDVQQDGDPFWFNNPQYRMTVDTPTEVLVSLMQQDRRSASHLRDNHPIGFDILRTKRAAAPARIWERRSEDLLADSSSATFAAVKPEREVSKGGILLDPRWAYNIVPAPQERSREGKFTLRVFSKTDVAVEPVAETQTQYLRGSWDRTSDRDTAGGPLRTLDEHKGVKSNPKWCQNPQFWLRLPEGSQHDSVDVKLVLRRTLDGPAAASSSSGSSSGAAGGGSSGSSGLSLGGAGHSSSRKSVKSSSLATAAGAGGGAAAGAGGSGSSAHSGKRSSLTHTALMGVVVCKAAPPDAAPPKRRQGPGAPRTNALGQPIPRKESSLKRRTRRWHKTGEYPGGGGTSSSSGNGGASSSLARLGIGMTAGSSSASASSLSSEDRALLAGVADHSEDHDGPSQGTPGARDSPVQLPDRKISVAPTEWCQMSEYRGSEASTTTLVGLKRDWMPHGLFLVPTLSEKGVKGGFTLEVHSDAPVAVGELPETVSRTIAAEWGEGSAGGCHLHPDTWKRNPCFHLRIKAQGPCRVRIALSRPEKDWRAACHSDSVGCMMGFYILQGARPVRTPGCIAHDGRPWDESPFVPTHRVATPAGFMLDSSGSSSGSGSGGAAVVSLTGSDGDVFTIMPATFEPGKKGPFHLSVVADAEFTLRRDRGGQRDSLKGAAPAAAAAAVASPAAAATAANQKRGSKPHRDSGAANASAAAAAAASSGSAVPAALGMQGDDGNHEAAAAAPAAHTAAAAAVTPTAVSHSPAGGRRQ